MAATDLSRWDTRWIDRAEDAVEAIRAWDDQPVVGVDTEFVRERTFWPQLALVQLSVPGQILLIDPLDPAVAQVLAGLLVDPTKLKVMHSASEDLQAFKVGCDALPSPLFDTQVAAALTGLDAGMGYQRLVQEVTGVALVKGETRSDWLKRPLSEKQREYAADDVRYLHAIHTALAGRLTERGRMAWLDADCARAVANAADDRGEPWPHLSVRSAQMLDAQAQARLCRMLLWREEQARRSDRPRSWIIDNELAVTLAKRWPLDRAGFDRMLDAQPKAPRQLRDPLWELLNQPFQPGEAEIPLTAPQDEKQRARIKAMQVQVAAVAASLEIPPGLLASKRHLETLALAGRWPEALGGWREVLLRPVLEEEMSRGD